MAPKECPCRDVLNRAYNIVLDAIPDRDDVDEFVVAAKKFAAKVSAVANDAAKIVAKEAVRVSLFLAGFAYKIYYELGFGGGEPSEFEVCAATVYAEDGRAIELSMNDAVRVSDTEAGDDKWASSVSDIAFGSEGVDVDFSWYLEIRYALRGKKYRAVAKTGEPFPRIQKTPVSSAPKILKAFLERTDDGTKIDITSRYLKFAGPLGDWHGSRVTAFDLFPNSDNDFYADESHDIVIIDNRLKTKRYAFAETTVISE